MGAVIRDKHTENYTFRKKNVDVRLAHAFGGKVYFGDFSGKIEETHLRVQLANLLQCLLLDKRFTR